MALHRTAVETAWYLFRDILDVGGMRINSFISSFDTEEDRQRTGNVFGSGRKTDDGWDSVFIQLGEFTPDQRRIWEEGKGKVPNSSFVNEPNEHGVWQIGFF